MKRYSFVRKNINFGIAAIVLIIAEVASTQFSFIFYQDIIPEKLSKRK